MNNLKTFEKFLEIGPISMATTNVTRKHRENSNWWWNTEQLWNWWWQWLWRYVQTPWLHKD